MKNIKFRLLLVLLLITSCHLVAENLPKYYLKINSINIISLYAYISEFDYNKIVQTNTIPIKYSQFSKFNRFAELLELQPFNKTAYLIYYNATNFYLIKGTFERDSSFIKRYGTNERVVERFPNQKFKYKAYLIRTDFVNILNIYFKDDREAIKSYMDSFKKE